MDEFLTTQAKFSNLALTKVLIL